MKGNFAAHLSESNYFNRSETDKVIEITLNKDTKTPGRTTGFSNNIEAVKRWEINASYRVALCNCFHKHLYRPKESKHADVNLSRIKKDENDVNAVISTLTGMFIHPFSENPLMSISTGILATEDVSHDLLNAKSLGKDAMNKFISERLRQDSTVSVFDPMKKMKLKTFPYLNKLKPLKIKDRTVMLQSTKDVFSKVAIIAQKRDIELKELFRFPMGPLPLSLAEHDVTLKKTAKSSIIHKLEWSTESIVKITEDYSFVIDGMACVRQVKGSKLAYEEFATSLLKFIIGLASSAKQVDVVLMFILTTP